MNFQLFTLDCHFVWELFYDILIIELYKIPVSLAYLRFWDLSFKKVLAIEKFLSASLLIIFHILRFAVKCKETTVEFLYYRICEVCFPDRFFCLLHASGINITRTFLNTVCLWFCFLFSFTAGWLKDAWLEYSLKPFFFHKNNHHNMGVIY